MNAQFFCREANRRRAVRDQGAINGFDYLEIASPDQKKLSAFFIHPLPGETGAVPPAAPPLTAQNFRIDGGVRITGIQILNLSVNKNVATLTVSARGDFSTYTLRLVSSANDADAPPPAGFDPALASIDFSFKAACPSDFDCEEKQLCPPPVLDEPALNYLAKDYPTFRQLLLDRVSSLVPGWTDRSEADLGVTIVELLAYTADQLSYRQDAIGTEAYLGTARSRISLRRHARLLDYRLHDGCNARAFVAITADPTADGKTLKANETLLLTRGSDARIVLAPSDLDHALHDDPTLFATMHDLTLSSAQNEIHFHTWSDAQCCLPRGATRATLKNNPPTQLVPGDLLLFEEIVGPISGVPADADPTHRHVVRLTRADAIVDPIDGSPILEVAWAAADALPFPLCVSVKLAGDITEVSVARGNIVLADHGYEGPPESVALEDVPADRAPRASLARSDVTFAVPFDPGTARSQPATRALATAPADALPVVSLEFGGDGWEPQRDLLGSDRFKHEFVVEVERDGVAHVRFGFDDLGERPPDGAQFFAFYRTGNGRAGNVGAESLVRIITTLPSNSILAVRNPLAATGGVDPESMEQVRQFAPQAFRRQERAVTAADWIEVAERHPEVQRAAADFRWTGSWHTVFVTIDRIGGRPVLTDTAFLADLRAHLEKFRVAGYDLEINGPVFVPLDLALMVCVASGYFRGDVEESLRDALSARDLPGGTRGFFHPDNFTFGQAVYLSQLVAAAMKVPGVASVVVTKFQRFGKKANGELDAEMLSTAALEIVRCDNDPNFPENGRLQLDVQGGL